MLNDIVTKCQASSKCSLLGRIVRQESDKEEIMDLKEDLQHAIRTFNVGLHIFACIKPVKLKDYQIKVTMFEQNTLRAILVGQEKLTDVMCT